MKGFCDTSCKDCVFAKYEGLTQVGCQFDRIEKFRKQGIEVVDAFDHEKEFCVIQAPCLAHRHKESPWARQTYVGKRLKACRKELEVVVEVVMVMGEAHTVEDVKKTADSLLSQTLLPSKVTVVVNREGVSPKEIRAVLPGDWIAKFILEKLPDGRRISVGRCVDHAVAASKSNFYAVFTPGFVVPPDFIKSLDVAVNDNLERFVMLSANKDGQGFTALVSAHDYYGGNSEAEDQNGNRVDTISEKIQSRIVAEGKEHLVRNVTEICPCL